MRYIKAYKLFESNISNNIITKDEFPSGEDIKDFFLDLLDELTDTPDIKILDSGYVSLSREFVFNNNLSSRTETELKDITIPIEKLEKPSGRLYTHFTIFTSLSNIDGNKTESMFYENIIKGDIPAYPYIELSRIYFDVMNKDKYKEKLDLLYESLRRLYEVTGFRPIGDFHLEDFVDEETCNIVTLYIADIKLFKCTDVEYKNLIKSDRVVSNPSGKENIEMAKKFL